MYSTRPGYIIGFHGCDEPIRDRILAGEEALKNSKNPYDWLGHGIYFFENSPKRALDFIQYLKDHPRPGKATIEKPSVIGAIINLGRCLDLLDAEYLELLRESHKVLEASNKKLGLKLPLNRNANGTKDLLLRDLDCLTIEYLHKIIRNPFDSVRGVFFEGDSLYPTSGFMDKNHIQICVRNPNCIKGYFLPRAPSRHYPSV